MYIKLYAICFTGSLFNKTNVLTIVNKVKSY